MARSCIERLEAYPELKKHGYSDALGEDSDNIWGTIPTALGDTKCRKAAEKGQAETAPRETRFRPLTAQLFQ